MKIAFASDHGGLELKNKLLEFIKNKRIETIDLGTNSNESVDYPDYAEKMAQTFEENKPDFGVLVCGTGIGISIAANRYKQLRTALVHDAFSARLSREHNNANVIAFGGRTTTFEIAKDALEIFLKTEFDGGRHTIRVNKMS